LARRAYVVPVKESYDVVIIGGGPNGLTAASYLANLGAKVLLLERRHDVGGGISSEQLAGFTINKYTLHFLLGQAMPPYSDLNLGEYGARFVKSEVSFSLIYRPNKSLTFYPDVEKTVRAISVISEHDARKFSKLYSDLQECFHEIFVPYSYLPPRPPGELESLLSRTEEGRRFLRWSMQTPLQILEEYELEAEELKAALLSVGCMWGLQPKREGLGHIFAAYLYGMLNSFIVLGGSGTLAFALMASGVRKGLTIREYAEVSKISVKDGEVKAVLTKDGNEFECKAVISTLDPVTTFLKLIGETEVDTPTIEAAKKWVWDPWSYFTIQLALRRRPKLKAAYNDSNCERASLQIFGYQSSDQVLKHFESTSDGHLSLDGFYATPIAALDPSQAPPGYDLYRFTTEVPYEVRGKDWAAEKDSFAEEILLSWTNYLSDGDGIRAVKKYVYPPTYIEMSFPNMSRGSINQGALIPSQLGYRRPSETASGCSTSIKGLYVGGASVHPGGPVLLAQGYLAAKRVAEYLGLRFLWPQPDFVERFIKRHAR